MTKEDVADVLRDLAAHATAAAGALDRVDGSLIVLRLREELGGIVAELSKRHLRPV